MEPRPATAHRHVVRVAWGDCDPARIVYTARPPRVERDVPVADAAPSAPGDAR